MSKRTLIAILLLFTCLIISANEVISLPGSDTWYSTGVVYELFVRSYLDTDGNRYGDLQGVISKLDYIKSLGVTAIWCMPVTKSAEHTNGYDPVDFMDIEEDYGTLDDYKLFIEECHKRDIKVIFDLVLNHTSDQHPFFQEALKNKNSKYRNWYIFAKEPEQKDHWFQNKNTGDWYYSYFAPTKPDLNYKNPEVREYMKKVMRFWINLGVDGFRFDAVSLLIENGVGMEKNQPETYTYYQELRKMLDTEFADREIFTVAESEPPYESYLGSGKDMFNAVFNFKPGGTIMRMVDKEFVLSSNGVHMIGSIPESMERKLSKLEGFAYYGTLLTNHDMYTGNRPFQQLGENAEKAALAGAIYLTLPGIPFVYYGEEIAMDTYTRSKGDRWLRCCMLWDDSKNAGFTSAPKPWTMVNENYLQYNVAKLDAEEDSILNTYRRIIKARVDHKALSLGSYQSLDVIGKKAEVVGAFIREYNDEKIIVIHNLSSKNATVKIDIANLSLAEVSAIVDDGASFKIVGGGKFLLVKKLSSYGSAIVHVK